MVKVYNSTEFVQSVKTSVDTYSVMPRSVATLDGDLSGNLPTGVTVVAEPGATKTTTTASK